MKEKIAKILEWFAKIYGGLVVLSVFASAITILITEGWSEFVWFFNPFNLKNYLVILIVLLPAIGAFYFSKHLSLKEPRSFGEFIKKHERKI